MILGLIPARGGSIGVPRKNARYLGPASLTQWAVKAAMDAGLEHVLVSTDDDEIRIQAQVAGTMVLERPADLAQADTPMAAVVRDVFEGYPDVEIMVLLQPTTPFRRPERIREALTILESTGADSVVSVVQVPVEYGAEWQFYEREGCLVPAMRYIPPSRQALRTSYIRDGGIYAFQRKSFEKHSDIYGQDCRALIVTDEESLNINTEADWEEAERRMGVLCEA